ncbi:MAG: nucleotide exchange factor GrpE [Candidatus Eremiobacterota bacterium]
MRPVPPSGESRAVKPPSASFLKPDREDSLRHELNQLIEEAAETEDPATRVPLPPQRPRAVEPVEEPPPPAKEEAPPPVGDTSPNPTEKPPPPSEEEVPQAAPAREEVKPRTEADPPARDDRLQAEIRELADVVHGLESLKFLEARVQKFLSSGADLAALVSVYRLTARTLKDELAEKDKMVEQFRKEFHRMKSAFDDVRRNRDAAAAAPAPPPQGDPVEMERLKKEARSLQEQLDAAQEQRNRLLQDFQNMRNRVQMDTDLKVHREKEGLIKKVLPVVDGFERAMDTVRSAPDPSEVTRGIEMLFKILMEALESEGLKAVETSGQQFDPRYHEAMGQVVTSDMPEDQVFDELARGYFLGERLLRPAMVRIAKAPADQPPQETPPQKGSEDPSPPPAESSAPGADPDAKTETTPGEENA